LKYQKNSNSTALNRRGRKEILHFVQDRRKGRGDLALRTLRIFSALFAVKKKKEPPLRRGFSSMYISYHAKFVLVNNSGCISALVA
jgi:hypothetical protein